MKGYKLTTQDFYTRKGKSNQLLWGENITHTALGLSTNLCSNGYIHFYEHPLIAVFMNPIHANIPNPYLWECEALGDIKQEALKSGAKIVTTIKQVSIPTVTTVNRIAFGIYSSLEIFKKPNFVKWANNWLENKDRSTDADAADADAADYAAAAAYAASAAAAAAAASIDFIQIANKAMLIN